MADADLARTIIDTNVYMTLGTADENGRPWASPVFFAHDGYTDFYWISGPETTHSRNIAHRPEVSIVVFDSQVPPGTGQAVYMAATAEQEPDLERGLQVYPGSPERGARAFTPEEFEPRGPFRLYRARVSEHSMLCKLERPCSEHGFAYDHRVAVQL